MLGSERKRKGQEMGHVCAQGTYFFAMTGGSLRRTPVLGVGPVTNREQGVLCAMACLFPSLSPFASTLPKGALLHSLFHRGTIAVAATYPLVS